MFAQDFLHQDRNARKEKEFLLRDLCDLLLNLVPALPGWVKGKMTDIQRASLDKRLGAFMIDFLIASIAQALLLIPFIIIPLIQKSIEPSQVTTRNLWCTLIAFGYFILRDLPNGQSIGKKALHLQTLGMDAEPASVGRLILRNLFIVLYPVEAIWLLLTSGQKRLGDVAARTGVFVDQTKKNA